MYIPIIKLAESEIRALENISFKGKDIIPLVELTRGRKKTIKLDKELSIVTFPFEKRLEKIKKIFKGMSVAFDLTSDMNLLSTEITELYDFNNGYRNWRDFLDKMKEENVFKKIIPSIIFNWDDDNFEENLKLQIQSLAQEYGKLIYRTPLQTKDYYEEIPLILKYLPANTDLCVLIDGGYLQEAIINDAVTVLKARIATINTLSKNYDTSIHIIISSTSFPNNVTEYGDKETDNIAMVEKKIYTSVKEEYNDIIYSDYASINPTRNDTITMARGWIPRIDIPIHCETYYYRVRRPKGTSAYKGAYILAAKKVIRDSRFPRNLDNNWGIQMVKACAYGSVFGSTPSFWISVRMNIHIEQIWSWLSTD